MPEMNYTRRQKTSSEGIIRRNFASQSCGSSSAQRCSVFATSIGQFVTMRFVQDIASSGGIVISRSVATDKFPGRDLARMLTLI